MEINSDARIEIGDISVKDRLPRVFRDEEVRRQTGASIEVFKTTQRDLPEKLKIAQFIFDRDEQICTADSRDKFLAWSATDLDLTANILSQIDQDELSVVLRSNMMDVPDDNPSLQVKSTKDIDDFLKHLDVFKQHLQTGTQVPPGLSVIWDHYFGAVEQANERETGDATLETTVVQLLKNITEQKGLFLIRPTFIYDAALRREITTFQADYPQSIPDVDLSIGEAPEAFVGFRVLPISEFAREKKTNMGYMFVYNPDTGALEPRSGFIDTDKYHDAQSDPSPRTELGRSIDFGNDNTTTFHYEKDGQQYDLPDITGLDSLHLNQADLANIQHVMRWQLPRIFSFEDEIRQQPWLPQGESTTHQFVIFPPQHAGDTRINTQYFDFHQYEGKVQLDEKATQWYEGKQFDDLTTEQKVVTFF